MSRLHQFTGTLQDTAGNVIARVEATIDEEIVELDARTFGKADSTTQDTAWSGWFKAEGTPELQKHTIYRLVLDDGREGLIDNLNEYIGSRISFRGRGILAPPQP